MSKPTQTQPTPEERQLEANEVRSLMMRANEGDEDAFRTLKARSNHWTFDILQALGITKTVRQSIAKGAMSEDMLYSQYSLLRESELLAESIAGPSPTPLEELLATQVSIDWLALRCAEALAESAGKQSLELRNRYQPRLESAHRRFMKSVKTLAQVRRLQIPNLVQVNIAEQNVNVS